MFKATDTAWAPWYVIQSDDKKRARLNAISHLLNHIPYEELPSREILTEGYRTSPANEEAMMRYLTATAMVASLSYATGGSGQVPPTQDRADTRHIYEACLASESAKGPYTASDGGISALRLMDQCKPQLDEWRIDCMAAAKSANQCNLLAASYAQAVLEQKARLSKE